MPSNYPPGVTESMIPGNRPEDAAWEKLHEQIDDDAEELGLDAEEAREVWEIGKRAAFEAMEREAWEKKEESRLQMEREAYDQE